ncbi:12226_t:CDS:2, partial [Cetraspora pellucida]
MEKIKKIRDEKISYKEIVMNSQKYMPSTWIQSPQGYHKVERDREYFINEERGGRFWFPIVFYFYSPGGSRKSELVNELFGDKLYDKPEKRRSGSNWWNGFEGQDILFLDEFYTKIDWMTMVNVLNDGKCKVQFKHGGFNYMIAKYIFMTSTKPPDEVYNFGTRPNDDDSNKHDYRQFERHLIYIIEFQSKWDDDIEKRTTEIIFHKGDERKNGKYNIEELVEKGEKFTENIN